jgi:hypothetical protein
MKPILVIVVLSLSLTAAFLPIYEGGLKWEQSVQERFYSKQLGNPFQQRPLTFWIVSGFEKVGVNPLNSLIFTRILIYLVLFCSLYLFYGNYLKLLIVPAVLLIPLTTSNMLTPLICNTLLDVALLAFGLVAIRAKRELWLLPIMAVGAMNRETILLLPFLGLGIRWKRVLPGLFVGLLAYTIVRTNFSGDYRMQTYPGLLPGIETVKANLQIRNLIPLLATISAIPLLVDFVNMKDKIRNVAITGFYTIGMFWFGCVNEPRLFLPVILLVLIPNIRIE